MFGIFNEKGENMEELKLFTKEEKEKLKEKIKDFKKLDSYQIMKMKFYNELARLNKLIECSKNEKLEVFKDVAKKHIEQLENYKRDLIESVGFVFEEY